MTTETETVVEETADAQPVKRRRRRRTNSQLSEMRERLLMKQMRDGLTPMKPLSPQHPVGNRPIHEFRTTGQIAQALRITRNRVHELVKQGRLSPSPVRMGIDTYLFHKTTSYQRRIPGWVPTGTVISAVDGEE